MGPGVLGKLLAGLPKTFDERLMVGFDASDDAAVYRIDENIAMIQTVDFFPPMVDDPRIFGQVAATNALSDVYAMGGTPRLAMNLLCIPSCLPLDAVGEILAGGADKVLEAGAIIAGGHSIEDKEPKYGLCVTGFAHPDAILTNSGMQPGDVLLLTKPLGSGILSTAAKVSMLTPEEYKALSLLMTTLNKVACETMLPLHPSACTDVTGFGLLGHAAELAVGSGVTLELRASAIPLLPRALSLAREGIIPAGAYRNRDYLADKVRMDGGVSREQADVFYDPQTAGGLLIAIPEARGAELLHRLQDSGVAAGIIGIAREKGDFPVWVKAN